MIVYSSKNSKKEIVICSMPGRKKPCLGIQEGNVITKVASFNDEKGKNLFVDTLVEFLEELVW